MNRRSINWLNPELNKKSTYYKDDSLQPHFPLWLSSYLFSWNTLYKFQYTNRKKNSIGNNLVLAFRPSRSPFPFVCWVSITKKKESSEIIFWHTVLGIFPFLGRTIFSRTKHLHFPLQAVLWMNSINLFFFTHSVKAFAIFSFSLSTRVQFFLLQNFVGGYFYLRQNKDFQKGIIRKIYLAVIFPERCAHIPRNSSTPNEDFFNYLINSGTKRIV